VAGSDTGSKVAAVIDPSVDTFRITRLLEEKSARLELIILTHGHFDHISALDSLRDATGAPALIHRADAEMLSDGSKNAYSFFFGENKRWRDAERLLDNGDTLTLGKESLKVISTPGHSKGSICLLGDGILITGDTLFADNIGRCDLYGGSMMEMYASLSLLAELDGDLTIYPGHGGTSTLKNALAELI
jgi:glyoxylase-like metal-dependent hydrolase (beta-lactamase superfamily II)